MATTKCHTLGGLKNRHLFFTALEAGKFKIKVPGDLVPGEDSSDFQMSLSHCDFIWRKSALLSLPLFMTLIPL